MKRALITGAIGQDGAYRAAFLLKKGHEVHGVKRRSSSFDTQRVDPLFVDPHGDLADSTNLVQIVQEVQSGEIKNLAVESHVQVSLKTPEYTANANAIERVRKACSEDQHINICTGKRFPFSTLRVSPHTSTAFGGPSNLTRRNRMERRANARTLRASGRSIGASTLH